MLLITLQVLLKVGLYSSRFTFSHYNFRTSHTLEAGEVVPEKPRWACTEATSNNFNVQCVMALLNMSPAFL